MLRAILLLLALSPASPAAWITYQNNTKEAVILQDVQNIGGRAVRGKPVKLAPGETFREFQAAAITKSIEVYQPGKEANKLLTSDTVTVKDQDVSLAIKTVNGAVKLTVAEPKKK